jgi:hypothetical protein
MVAKIDVTGERYGRLVAIRRVGPVGGKTFWLFRCDCGSLYECRLENVRHSHTRSCGCQKAEGIAARSLKHGHQTDRKESRTLKCYRHAKSRCENPNDQKFPIYGGRGIKMCERWSSDFSAFLEDMGECPAGLSIDRIDPHKGYSPENCRWATTPQQARTRTDNIVVEHNGALLILKDFAAVMGVNYKTLHSRVRYKGMTAHDAATAILRLR